MRAALSESTGRVHTGTPDKKVTLLKSDEESKAEKTKRKKGKESRRPLAVHPTKVAPRLSCSAVRYS